MANGTHAVVIGVAPLMVLLAVPLLILVAWQRHLRVSWHCFADMFPDDKLRKRYMEERSTQAFALMKLTQPVIMAFAAAWLILPSDSPTPVWIFYRVNNVFSALYVTVAMWWFNVGPSHRNCGSYITWRHNVFPTLWVIHHLAYNSLTSNRVSFLLGVPVDMDVYSDEGYQLLFNLIGLSGFVIYSKVHFQHVEAVAMFGAYWWAICGMFLGMYMDAVDFWKLGAAYCCIMFFIVQHSRMLEMERVGHWLRTAEFEQQSVRQHGLVECFRRTIALNFDAVSTLLELDPVYGLVGGSSRDSELHAFCGRDLCGQPLLTCVNSEEERARLLQFGLELCRQVEREPEAFSHPAKLAVAFKPPPGEDAVGSREVELQAMWMPGCEARERTLQGAQPRSLDGHTHRGLGMLWVAFRGLDGISSGASPAANAVQPQQARLPKRRVVFGMREERADLRSDTMSEISSFSRGLALYGYGGNARTAFERPITGESEGVTSGAQVTSAAASVANTLQTERAFTFRPPGLHSDAPEEAWRSHLDGIRRIGQTERWLIDFKDVILFPDRIIGAGSFGVVVAGCVHGTDVAVKFARRQRHGAPLPAHVLMNELRVLRRVRHPNVVLWLGASIDHASGDLVMILEYVRGVALNHFILGSSGGGPSATERHHVILDACCALRHLHALTPPIVHGSLKAPHVVVERLAQGVRAKLVDFGASRLLGSRQAHLACGALDWMAPEARDLRAIPALSADVYSFGCLVYFTLLGRSPRAAPGNLWPPGTSLREDFRTLCRECLHTEADARPTMEAVHRHRLMEGRAPDFAQSTPGAAELHGCVVRRTFLEAIDRASILEDVREADPWLHSSVGIVFASLPFAFVAMREGDVVKDVQEDGVHYVQEDGINYVHAREAILDFQEDGSISESRSVSESEVSEPGTVVVQLAPLSPQHLACTISLRHFLSVPYCPRTKKPLSVGSSIHFAGGTCTPCFWLQRGRDCKFGWRCPHCHAADHHGKYRRWKKTKHKSSDTGGESTEALREVQEVEEEAQILRRRFC